MGPVFKGIDWFISTLPPLTVELNPPTACSCWEVQAYPVPGRTKGFVTLYLSSFQGIHVQGMQFVDCLQTLAKGIRRHTKVPSESLWFVNHLVFLDVHHFQFIWGAP